MSNSFKNCPALTALTIALSFGFLSTPALAQSTAPTRFEDYVFKNPLKAIPKADRDALRKQDKQAFMKRFLPKLGLPVKREQFFGIWNYYCHSSRSLLVYDGDSKKKTYGLADGVNTYNHNSIDWMVSFQEFGKNLVLSPFPKGAVVEVTQTYDKHKDEHKAGALGNTLTLTCYLDGDAKNKDHYNRFTIRFAHLEKDSIIVKRGDIVKSQQSLAKIGYSGATSLSVTHIHTDYRYGGRLDPFKGYANTKIAETLFFDQRIIESKTNYSVPGFRVHLRLNKAFFHKMKNNQWNNYTFTSLKPLTNVYVTKTPNGKIAPFDVLPHVKNIRRRTFTFRDDEGRNYTIHELKFRFFNKSPKAGEWIFNAKTAKGKLSNNIWLDLR